MEDNQGKLRGKQIAWHKEVKEEAFAGGGSFAVAAVVRCMTSQL